VRVSVVRGGGFGGLVRTTTADTDHLSPQDREELAVLVRQAGLLEASSATAAPATSAEEPAPDRFTYAVTVQDHGQEHKARFSERSLPGEVRNLISWVGKVSGHEESIGSPGRAEN
jgi:subtilisin family serine protease